MADGQIFSIGYGKHTQETLLKKLLDLGVSYVIDVRSSPYSRYQPEFSREPLNSSLSRQAIRYVFMGELLGGRPADIDCYTDGKVDYTKTRKKDFFQSGISRLKKATDQGLRVCLLCSESHPGHCHRSKLIGQALLDDGLHVSHILSDGSIKDQSEVFGDLVGPQADFFGDHFVSRKVYR